MTHSPRFQIGPQFRLPGEMEELGRRLGELPDQFRQTLEPLYERALESFRLRSRIMNVAKDALERMRLEMTCIQFDLEVTRREKEALEKQLEGE